jgi:AraC family transcriptional regulator of adaptative response/methylated-DNA-[protein]-cysteine methyltransferase
MLMAATDKGICWLAFGEEPGAMLQDLHAAFPKARCRNDEPRLMKWFDAVREFVLLPREALQLPLDIQGTAFEARVWRALRRVPLGRTVSYGELARRLKRPTASRAVASACAHNKLALLIPCHRVVGADGRLSGYRWGTQRKATLLEREAGVRKTA